MSYRDFINPKNDEEKEEKEEKKEAISEKNAEAINQKTAKLNIIGHICVILFVGLCIVFGVVCLINAFGGSSIHPLKNRR